MDESMNPGRSLMDNPRIPFRDWPLWAWIGYYAFYGSPFVHGLVSVALTLIFYDSDNWPLTICLNVYLVLSCVTMVCIVGSILLWERWGKRRRKGKPDPRGPSHN
jgi:hypothetical protein